MKLMIRFKTSHAYNAFMSDHAPTTANLDNAVNDALGEAERIVIIGFNENLTIFGQPVIVDDCFLNKDIKDVELLLIDDHDDDGYLIPD